MLGAMVLGFSVALGKSTLLQTAYIDIPHSKDRVAVHCLEPQQSTASGVLFVHGATFPTKLSSGYEFHPGDSWLSFVAAQGYLACGLDFLGYGASTRPAAMLAPADRAAPVTRAPEAAAQIALAVEYLHRSRGLTGVHLIAHSWGTIPAATFRPRSASPIISASSWRSRSSARPRAPACSAPRPSRPCRSTAAIRGSCRLPCAGSTGRTPEVGSQKTEVGGSRRLHRCESDF